MKRAFKITNKYIILVTPLLLFSLFILIYLIITGLRNIFFLFLFLIMSVAFASGWFNMIKIATLEENENNPNFLWKEFPQGVGEYFLSVLGASGIAFVVAAILFIIGYLIGDLTIGINNIPLNELRQALAKPDTLEMFLRGLTSEQTGNLLIWYALSLLMGFILYLLLMLYLPAIFFENKNPIKAFMISLKNLFSKHFIKTVFLLLILTSLNTLVSALVPLSSFNLFINGLMILLKFYVMTIIFVTISCYYSDNFLKK